MKLASSDFPTANVILLKNFIEYKILIVILQLATVTMMDPETWLAMTTLANVPANPTLSATNANSALPDSLDSLHADVFNVLIYHIFFE